MGITITQDRKGMKGLVMNFPQRIKKMNKEGKLFETNLIVTHIHYQEPFGVMYAVRNEFSPAPEAELLIQDICMPKDWVFDKPKVEEI